MLTTIDLYPRYQWYHQYEIFTTFNIWILAPYPVFLSTSTATPPTQAFACEGSAHPPDTPLRMGPLDSRWPILNCQKQTATVQLLL